MLAFTTTTNWGDMQERARYHFTKNRVCGCKGKACVT